MPSRVYKWYFKHLRHQPLYVIINTIAAIAFAILFWWSWSIHNQSNSTAKKAKITAVQAHELANQNSKLIVKVQNNRRDLIYKNCRDQNDRHDNSLKALRALLKKSGVSQARQDQSFTETKILIDALVPHRNCVKLANKVVKPKLKER